MAKDVLFKVCLAGQDSYGKWTIGKYINVFVIYIKCLSTLPIHIVHDSKDDNKYDNTDENKYENTDENKYENTDENKYDNTNEIKKDNTKVKCVMEGFIRLLQSGVLSSKEYVSDKEYVQIWQCKCNDGPCYYNKDIHMWLHQTLVCYIYIHHTLVIF